MAVAAPAVRLGLAAAAITAAGLFAIARLPHDAESRLSYDGIRYYAGALSIAETGRYTDLTGRPQQHWPPGMSLLYAALWRVTGIDALALVPAVNAVGYVTTMLALLLLAHELRMRWWTAALMLAAFGWNSHFISLHNKMWSEPPAMALLALMLWCAMAALRRPERAGRFIAAACVCASAAILLRYAALAFVPVLVAVPLRIRRPLLALAPLLAPLVAWLTLTLLGASRGNRGLAVQPARWDENAAGIFLLGEQILPQRLWGAGVLVILLWLVAAAFFVRRERAHVLLVALLWCAAYAAFLPAAQMLIVPAPWVDLRMLMPLYVALIVLAAAATHIAAETRRHILAATLALPMLVAAARAARAMFATPPPAPPCVSRQWYIDTIRRAAPTGTLASNAQGTVWLALRRPVEKQGPADTFIWIDADIACEQVVDEPSPPPRGGTPERGLIVTTRRHEGRPGGTGG